MSTFSDTPLSALASAMPTTSSANWKILLAVTIGCLLLYALQALSPIRLLDLLILSIESAEKTYFAAMEAGILGDTHATALASLQVRVSQIRQQTLANSQSLAVGLREFFKGHSFTILRGIRDARKFETEIEMLKEAHLQSLPSNRGISATLALRRRKTASPVNILTI
ncbi:hypothetical protein FB45DRAFT_74056 [Roridomyces roridus]|uniref:Uncharacterized protein n=1 Tax=Roridomyces roridus TaxID=1738132 RepID=A0AAD7BNZ0_9AGAR|nr:hypothetical protein FB45DRAFT_74056 [Roridomyces roridus]